MSAVLTQPLWNNLSRWVHRRHGSCHSSMVSSGAASAASDASAPSVRRAVGQKAASHGRRRSDEEQRKSANREYELRAPEGRHHKVLAASVFDPPFPNHGGGGEFNSPRRREETSSRQSAEETLQQQRRDLDHRVETGFCEFKRVALWLKR